MILCSFVCCSVTRNTECFNTKHINTEYQGRNNQTITFSTLRLDSLAIKKREISNFCSGLFPKLAALKF